ncbi:hypothetical protein [Variovorax sp. 38R]|uniref:hypothetical protein n=1 Tax=Variovorax sp. 38R TaxID=2774875 RepID=UPI00177E25C4|nr:hypothetical protein [Variovorax sp. 38R]QOF76079.1 hypothetical protein IG196_16850 [Variovorax sp. 38R]
MDDKSLTHSGEAEASSSLETRVAQVLSGPGHRAAMVVRRGGGGFTIRPIEHGKSIVNIQRDLLVHLNEIPFEDGWLMALRDYCDGRLKARAEARSVRGFITPKPAACWDLTVLSAGER